MVHHCTALSIPTTCISFCENISLTGCSTALVPFQTLATEEHGVPGPWRQTTEPRGDLKPIVWVKIGLPVWF